MHTSSIDHVHRLALVHESQKAQGASSKPEGLALRIAADSVERAAHAPLDPTYAERIPLSLRTDAQLQRIDAQDSTLAPNRGAEAHAGDPVKAAADEKPKLFGPNDLEALKAAWGKKSGEEGFNATYDLNGDGVIDGKDLARLLLNFAQPEPEPEPEPEHTFTAGDIEKLLSSWGKKSGEEGFIAMYDLNGDGVIDGRDLGHLLTILQANAEPTNPEPTNPEPPLTEPSDPGSLTRAAESTPPASTDADAAKTSPDQTRSERAEALGAGPENARKLLIDLFSNRSRIENASLIETLLGARDRV